MAILDHNHTILADIPPAAQSQDRAFAWACSVCVHTLALAVAFVAAVGLRELPQAPAPVARLEILLSESQHEAEQATATDPQGRTDPATHQETDVLTEDSSPITPSPSPSIKSEPSQVVKQPESHRVAAATPAQPAPAMSSAADYPLPVENPKPLENQSESPPPVKEPDVPVPSNPSETIEQAENTTATSSAPEPIAKNVHDHAEPSPQHQESTSPPTDQAPMVDSQTGSSGSPTASSEETVAFNHPAITQSVSARSQYEWLMELLRRRIMSLQAYPHQARMQGWEGVVVIKATIDKNGSLIDAVLTKSSGYGALDEDAVKLMHRVCPVHLTQDLGKSKIAVLIPIRYRLDGF